MIDHTAETLVSLSDAATRMPRRRGGKRVSVATLYRWSTHGCKGVRLETIQIGGTRCTSAEALQRFFETLSGPGPREGDVRRPTGIRRRRRDAAAVVAELDRLGL